MHSIRKFVGRGVLAVAISAVVVLAVAVQAGQAARLNDNASQMVTSSSASAHVTQTSVHLNVALSSPSPACTSALAQLQAAVKNDLAEDMAERSANATDTETGADQTEDTNERASFKPLISAVVTACGTTHAGTKAPIVPKTPACAAAIQALKAGFAQARTQQQAEFANHTEGTAADQAEDQATASHLQSLWAAVKAACSTSNTTGTTTFSTWWQHR